MTTVRVRAAGRIARFLGGRRVRYAHALSGYLKSVGSEEDHARLPSVLAELAPEDRHGGPHADHTRRGMAADYLSGLGREDEAALLRGGRHVLVDGGAVREGRFDLHPVRRAYEDLLDHLRVTNPETPHYPFDFHRTAKMPYGSVAVWSNEEPRAYAPELVPAHRLPQLLADSVHAHYGPDDYARGDAADDPDALAHLDEYERLLAALKAAPVEDTYLPARPEPVPPIDPVPFARRYAHVVGSHADTQAIPNPAPEPVAATQSPVMPDPASGEPPGPTPIPDGFPKILAERAARHEATGGFRVSDTLKARMRPGKGSPFSVAGAVRRDGTRYAVVGLHDRAGNLVRHGAFGLDELAELAREHEWLRPHVRRLGGGPERYARDPGKPHKFSSTQIAITGPVADRLREMAAALADEDLADDGREDDYHATALFGLENSDPDDVRRVVSGFGPVKYRLGKVTAFYGKDSGKDYDVVKVDVDSPDLVRLHDLLKQLPHTETHPSYVPHVTLGYVRAGLADKYLKRFAPLDADGTADELVFSDKTRTKTAIPLDGGRRRYAAYKAPAGGVVVRGTFFPGGMFIPDLEKFVTGAARRALAARLGRYFAPRKPATTGDAAPLIVSYARAVKLGAMRYSASHADADNLLGQLDRPEHDAARRGDPGADHTLRLVAADALSDTGREDEASLLRDHTRHVVIHDGRVRPGRFTIRHLQAAMDRFNNGLPDGPWDLYPYFAGHPDAENIILDDHTELDPAKHFRDESGEPMAWLAHEGDIHGAAEPVSAIKGEMLRRAARASRSTHFPPDRIDRLVTDLAAAPVEEPVPEAGR